MNLRIRVALIAVALLGGLQAATVKDRAVAVRGDRAAMEHDARWIYNDVDRGFAEAKRTGKPLLVVLRCVPCHSCVGLDAEVLKESSLLPVARSVGLRVRDQRRLARS